MLKVKVEATRNIQPYTKLEQKFNLQNCHQIFIFILFSMFAYPPWAHL